MATLDALGTVPDTQTVQAGADYLVQCAVHLLLGL